MIQVLQRMLGKSIMADQPLMEAGLDSLSAMDLRVELISKLATDLPATLTYDHPTANAIIAHILSQQDSSRTQNANKVMVQL